MKRQTATIYIISTCVFIALAAAACGLRQNSENNRQYGKVEYTAESAPASYRFPGEFEKQQAIWMQWPKESYDAGNRPVSPTMINIIKAFARYIKVNVISRSMDDAEKIKGLLRESGYNGTNVHFYNIPHYTIWARDVGPIFIKDSQNRLNVINFGFNNYSRDGSRDFIDIESEVDKLAGKVLGLPVINSSLISEGGGIESNGSGTLMSTESVALNRNPGMTLEQIEKEYKSVLGVKKIVWLKKGLAEDDGITTGHINEIARFADANTILLAKILPEDRYASSVSQESYLRLEENYNILKNSTDQDGKPFRIIRIPMPPTLYQEAGNASSIPVRSYINYAVTNGAVLMQTYWKQGRSDILKKTEEQVKDILRSVFPGRDIIGIDAENVNLWGGGIHCITQHMPA
jgi:agmatine deiminase